MSIPSSIPFMTGERIQSVPASSTTMSLPVRCACNSVILKTTQHTEIVATTRHALVFCKVI
jgi:hypothetical protein